MRCSGRALIAGLVLAICASPAHASGAEKEPVSGGLLPLPGSWASTYTAAPEDYPAPAAGARATGGVDDTSWGVLLRGGYFGVPNSIADELFTQHPEVKGSSIGAEIRYHGEGGGRGGTSIGLAVDYATAEAEGTWQQDESDSPQHVSGEVNMLAITLTGYAVMFPSWYVHPYIGIGIGAARVQGHYQDEEERVDADVWIPAVHIPVGLAVELGERLQLAIEGRFIDGIAIGGALQVRF